MEQRSVLKDINGQLNMNPLLAQVLSPGKKNRQDNFRRRTIQQTPCKHDEDDSDSSSSDDYRSAEEDDDFNLELDSMIRGISSVHILTPNGKKIKSQLQKSYNLNGTLDLELTKRLAKEYEITNQSFTDKENISVNIPDVTSEVISESQCDTENKFSSILNQTFESVCDSTVLLTVSEFDKTSHNAGLSEQKLLTDVSISKDGLLVNAKETEVSPNTFPTNQEKCLILNEKVNNTPNTSKTICVPVTEELTNLSCENSDRALNLENNLGSFPTSSSSKDCIANTSTEIKLQEISNENPSETICVPHVDALADSTENSKDRFLILENKNQDFSPPSNSNDDIVTTSNEMNFQVINNEPNPSETICVPSIEVLPMTPVNNDSCLILENKTIDSRSQSPLNAKENADNSENQLPDLISESIPDQFPDLKGLQLMKISAYVPSLKNNQGVPSEIRQSNESTPCENTEPDNLKNDNRIIEHSELQSIISESIEEDCGSHLSQTIEIAEKPDDENADCIANLQAPAYHTDTSSISAEDRKHDCYNLDQTRENIEQQENLSTESSTSSDNLNQTAIICNVKANNVDEEKITNETSAETTFLHDVIENASENIIQNLNTTTNLVNINTRDVESENIKPDNLEENTNSEFNETVVSSAVIEEVSNNIAENINITQTLTNLDTTRDIESENVAECDSEKKSSNLNETVTNDNTLEKITTIDVEHFGEQFEPSSLKPDETFKFAPVDKKIANSTFLEEVHKTQENHDEPENHLLQKMSDEFLNTEPISLGNETLSMDDTVILSNHSADDCPKAEANDILNDTYTQDTPQQTANLNETVVKIVNNQNHNDTFGLSEKPTQQENIAGDDLELTKLINITISSNSDSETQNSNAQCMIPIMNFEPNGVLSANVAKSNLPTIDSIFENSISSNPYSAFEKNDNCNLSKNTLELFEDFNTTGFNSSGSIFSLLDSSNIENVSKKSKKAIEEKHPSDNCLLQLDESISHVPKITKNTDISVPKNGLNIPAKSPNKNLLDSTMVIHKNTQNNTEVLDNRSASPKSTSSIFKWIGQFLSPGKPGDETTDSSTDKDVRKASVSRHDQTSVISTRQENDFASLGDETPLFMSVSTTMSETFNESRANNEEQMEYLKELSELREQVAANDDKLKNLRLQVSSYQTTACELEDKVQAHEKTLARKLEHEQIISVTMANFEKRVKELTVENEALTRDNVSKLEDYKKNRDSAQNHLSSVESAFSRLHKKYEQCKGAIDVLKTNQDALKATNDKLRETAMEQKIVAAMLEEHAGTNIEKAHADLESIERQHAIEMVKWNALIKKATLKKNSLEEALNKQKEENVELGVMCDQLLLKLG